MSCKNLTCRGITTPRALCDREDILTRVKKKVFSRRSKKTPKPLQQLYVACENDQLT